MYLESKESHVPTSVWNDQLTGQSQWDDGMLVDQGRERPCGRRQHVRTSVPGSGPGCWGAQTPHPTICNLQLLDHLSLLTPVQLKIYPLLVSKI